MTGRAIALALAALPALAAPSAGAEWKPVEKVETYAVAGSTGIELYRSIGERGPLLGVRRAIAYTDFDLKWSRDYRPQPDGSCRLVSARPHLVITYRLPKPAGRLPAATGERWQAFIEGIAAHEKVHGAMIVDLVREIEAVSVGLSAADDRDCRKVRAALQERLGPLSQAQRARSRAFDQAEMGAGGNVHRLVLALVNG